MGDDVVRKESFSKAKALADACAREESLRLQQEALALARRTSRQNKNIQIVGAVVGVIGLVLAVLVAWQPWSRGSPAALARLVPRTHNAVIPSGIAQVTTPPQYSPDLSADHCDLWWRSWFEEQAAAEDAVPTIEISAPSSAGVTVTSATIHVFRSYTPSNLSYVECVHSAGPMPGTLLNVNLDRPDDPPTLVADDGSDRPLSMPDAVIDIGPGRTELLAVTPRGMPRLYEWSVDVGVIVNQRRQTFTFGSATDPLRAWLGKRPTNSYDYNLASRSWEPVK